MHTMLQSSVRESGRSQPWKHAPGRWAVFLAPVLALLAARGCSTQAPDPATDDGSDFTPSPSGGLAADVPPITKGDWYRPGVSTTWQWQLQPNAAGEINTSYDVEVYDIDLFDVAQSVSDALHTAGRRVICYFSAGSFEAFRSDASEFQPSDIGKLLEGYDDENWLDVRSANVQRIMLDRLDLAAAKGCDGVEPDNVDGYANDNGLALTAVDQLAFNRFIANSAHERGLSVGLKNDLDQVTDLVAYFDFAVNEQCHEYDECDLLDPFLKARKAVFNAEYNARYVDEATELAALCDSALLGDLRTLVLPVELDDSYRFSCDP